MLGYEANSELDGWTESFGLTEHLNVSFGLLRQLELGFYSYRCLGSGMEYV